MSYWKPGIWDVICDRLNDDATLTASGLLNGQKVYPDAAPPGTTFPYITITIPVAADDDVLSVRGRLIQVDIHVWVNERTSGIDAGTLRSGIMERVAGDWQENANHRPTYGFDRWQPGQIGTTGWYVNEFVFKSEHDRREPGLYHDVYTIQGGVYKAGA